jgi:hypothetical protein
MSFVLIVLGLFGGVFGGIAVARRFGADEIGAPVGGFLGFCIGFVLGWFPAPWHGWIAALLGLFLLFAIGTTFRRRSTR